MDRPPEQPAIRVDFALSDVARRDALKKGHAARSEESVWLGPGDLAWDRAVDLVQAWADDAYNVIEVGWYFPTVVQVGEKRTCLDEEDPFGDLYEVWPPPTLVRGPGTRLALSAWPDDISAVLDFEESIRKDVANAQEKARRELESHALREWEEWATGEFAEFCKTKVAQWRCDKRLARSWRDDALAAFATAVDDRDWITAVNAIENAMVVVGTAMTKSWRDEAKRRELLEAEEWVRAHGSTRLKKAAQLDVLESSLGVYRDERLAAERPGWQWWSDDLELRDILNPEEWVLDALQAARELEPTASLRYMAERHYRGPVIVSYFLGRGIVLQPEEPPPPSYYDEEPF
jgi:hypothetical protein